MPEDSNLLKKLVRKGKNFTVPEDEQIARSWLNVSQDPRIGTNQDQNMFWQKVLDHFETYILPEGTRTTRGIQSRFLNTISPDCAKFASCFATANDLDTSGTNVDDTYAKALRIFNAKYNKIFTLRSVWEILKDAPKWQTYRDLTKVACFISILSCN